MRIWRFFVLCILFFGSGAFAWAQELSLPPANRIGAQRYLFQAYEMYAKNRFPEALAYLDRAIEKNTYLIDYYLMRSLVLRRTGNFAEALKEMNSYLEVRPLEAIPRKIRENLRRLDAFTENALRGTLPKENYVLERVPLKSLFGMTPLLRKNLAGVGKIQIFGDLLFLPDTLGNQLYVLDLENPYEAKVFETPSPVRVLSLQGKEILLCSQEGELRQIDLETREESLAGSLEKVFLKDGVLLSDSRLIFADWGGRRLFSVSYPDLTPLWEWSPRGNPVDFAPQGLALCGNLLAVADGGGDRLFLLQAEEGTLLKEEPFRGPLDVGWTAWGSLGVLDERGEVFLQDPSGEFQSFASLPGAWSFAIRDMNLVFSHVSGEVLWFASMRLPHNFDISFFWLQSPEYGALGGGGTARFQGGLGHPVAHLFPGNSGIFEESYAVAIWMDAGLEGRVEKVLSRHRYTLYAHRGSRIPPHWDGISLAVVPGSFFDGLARVAQNERGVPGKILLDPDISLSFEEQKRLLGYALFNGIPVSLVRSVAAPPASLVRIARLTGGDERALLSLESPREESLSYVFFFPLNPDIYPSGYPSRSFFTLFLETSYYSFMDWMPFWPAGLEGTSLEAIPQQN
jgi:hypothetical protein